MTKPEWRSRVDHDVGTMIDSDILGQASTTGTIVRSGLTNFTQTADGTVECVRCAWSSLAGSRTTTTSETQTVNEWVKMPMLASRDARQFHHQAATSATPRSTNECENLSGSSMPTTHTTDTQTVERPRCSTETQTSEPVNALSQKASFSQTASPSVMHSAVQCDSSNDEFEALRRQIASLQGENKDLLDRVRSEQEATAKAAEEAQYQKSVAKALHLGQVPNSTGAAATCTLPPAASAAQVALSTSTLIDVLECQRYGQKCLGGNARVVPSASPHGHGLSPCTAGLECLPNLDDHELSANKFIGADHALKDRSPPQTPLAPIQPRCLPPTGGGGRRRNSNLYCSEPGAASSSMDVKGNGSHSQSAISLGEPPSSGRDSEEALLTSRRSVATTVRPSLRPIDASKRIAERLKPKYQSNET